MSAPWPYPVDWYAKHARGSLLNDALRVGRAIMETFHPSEVVDIGCAVGGILDGMRSVRGDRPRVRVGIDHPEAVRIVLENYLWQPGMFCPLWGLDLEGTAIDQLPVGWGDTDFDLAICTEVGEHLPEASAAGLVRFVTSLSDLVVWSAAIPGQGGEVHVNEQPTGYWASLFMEQEFYVDATDTESLRDAVGPIPTASWYERLFVYRERKGA